MSVYHCYYYYYFRFPSWCLLYKDIATYSQMTCNSLFSFLFSVKTNTFSSHSLISHVHIPYVSTDILPCTSRRKSSCWNKLPKKS